MSKHIAVNLSPAEWALPEEKRTDHRELLKNFYLFTNATVNDLRALEAIGEPAVAVWACCACLTWACGGRADVLTQSQADLCGFGFATMFP